MFGLDIAEAFLSQLFVLLCQNDKLSDSVHQVTKLERRADPVCWPLMTRGTFFFIPNRMQNVGSEWDKQRGKRPIGTASLPLL